MIRIATLFIDIDTVPRGVFNDLASSLKKEEIDILCCGTRVAEAGADYTFTRDLADSLDMTYTYSNISLPMINAGRPKKKNTVGMSILTGKNSWVLNSGSLSFNNGNGERRAQFGVIRHESNSILLVNTLLFSGNEGREQLGAMLSLPILKEQFGAVILCPHMEETVPPQEFTPPAALNCMKIHRMPLDSCASDIPLVLTSTDNPPASLKINAARPLAAAEEQAYSALGILTGVTELSVNRIRKEKRKKKYTPLSFRERWLGSRDGNGAFAF